MLSRLQVWVAYKHHTQKVKRLKIWNLRMRRHPVACAHLWGLEDAWVQLGGCLGAPGRMLGCAWEEGCILEDAWCTLEEGCNCMLQLLQGGRGVVIYMLDRGCLGCKMGACLVQSPPIAPIAAPGSRSANLCKHSTILPLSGPMQPDVSKECDPFSKSAQCGHMCLGV